MLKLCIPQCICGFWFKEKSIISVIEVGKTISDEITVPDRLKTSLSWIKDSATEIKLKKSIHNGK